MDWNSGWISDFGKGFCKMGKDINKIVYDERKKRKIVLERITPSEAITSPLKRLYVSLCGTFSKTSEAFQSNAEFLIEPISGTGNPKIYKVLDWKGHYFTLKGLNKEDKEKVICDDILGGVSKYYRELS